MQAKSRVIVFDPLSGSGPRQGTDSISFNRPVHTAVAALTGDTVADRKPEPALILGVLEPGIASDSVRTAAAPVEVAPEKLL